jgi:hypothetical protein
MAARHSFVLPEDKRMPDIKDSLRWEFERAQDQFFPRMAEDGPYLMGESSRSPTSCWPIAWAGRSTRNSR